MKKLMHHFTKIMNLYQTVDLHPNDPKYDEEVCKLKAKYSKFTRDSLPQILSNLKLVRRITGQKIFKKGYERNIIKCQK